MSCGRLAGPFVTLARPSLRPHATEVIVFDQTRAATDGFDQQANR